ncbi:hypothetical protein SO802_014677 [Lithocarpus litseifolius]|uniref:F-box domain-containing protein n=1 Tax=Lithocarpus litseifolius TaxID=425828 RepID=A0AAW2CRT6_9ROSI
MADNMDMFRKLSEHLILIIISFLPFKEAVRTSVLSKRWRYIWHETRNIEFDERAFVDFRESQEMQASQRRGFMDFALRRIHNYQGRDIDKFQLTLSKPENFHGDIQRCISFAITHNVKGLGLDFSDPTWAEDNLDNHAALFDLPLNVYGHVVLESIKLFSCNFRNSDFMNFRALKQVSFGWLELSLSFIEALLKNCPLLESLSLKKCWNLDHLEISGQNLRLKNFVADNCSLISDEIVIDAPYLRFFKYSGKMAHFEIEIHRSHMEEADLDFGIEFEHYDGIGTDLYNLLNQLYPIKVLTVCSFMLQFLPLGDEPVRMGFDMRIKHLTLKTSVHPFEFIGIGFLLNSCPHLETLTLDIGPRRIFGGYRPPVRVNFNRFWLERSIKYKCVRESLKVVKVKGFKGTMHELSLLAHMIIYGRILERVDVTVSKEEGDNGGNENRYREIANAMLEFPRASPILQISIN